MSISSKRVTGPGAASVKYDVLTALGAAGLNAALGPPVTAMRLITLITARYNWQRDELTVGQREMARLWGVSERTAKRDVRHWTDLGLLVCRRGAARGRVACYRLDLTRLWALTEPAWAQVGRDFRDRMAAGRPETAGDNVIRLADRAADSDMPEAWRAVSDRLQRDDPGRHRTWIAPLLCSETGDGILTLTAPSRFAASYIETHLAQWISAAMIAENGPGAKIVLHAN